MQIEQVIEMQNRLDGLFDLGEVVAPDRVVLKMGSDVVVNKDGLFNTRLAHRVAGSCSQLMDEKGLRFVIVTSGAFALGSIERKKSDPGFDPYDCSPEIKQVLASNGQIVLSGKWMRVFRKFGKETSQFLISDNDWNGKNPEDTKNRIEELRRPLLRALMMRYIPVDNGNDGTNSTGMRELLTSADNDPLSVMRARMAYAKYLILMTSVDGVLDQDKKVIPQITSLDDLVQIADHGKLNNGTGEIYTGGIYSKVTAAVVFARGGREAFIINGRRFKINTIEDVLAGRIGTRIALAA